MAVERLLGEMYDSGDVMESVDEVLVVESSTGGQKGLRLSRYDLIPPEVLTALAEHYGKNSITHGGKYEEENWKLGMPWSWNYRAMIGHAVAFWAGEDIDKDSGSYHLTAVMWHAVALLFYVMNPFYKQFDNRPKKGS